LSLLFATSALAQEPPKPPPEKKADAKPRALPTLLVFDLAAEKGVDAGHMGVLTELVIDKVTKSQRYQVVGQKDLDKMLFWEQNKQLKGCTDTACLVQIAGAMGAQYYVEGSIGGLGDEYIITLKLIEAQSVKVLERSTEKVSRDEKALSRGMERVADIILGNKTVADAPSGARVGAPEAKPVPSKAEGRSAPVETAAVEPAPAGFDKKLWGMTGTFAGIGVLALGGVFAGLSKQASDAYAESATPAEMTGNADRHSLYKTLAIAGFVTGGVLAAAGGTLWYLGAQETKGAAGVRFAPSVGPVGAGATFAGSW
jgi:TolB-like protein